MRGQGIGRARKSLGLVGDVPRAGNGKMLPDRETLTDAEAAWVGYYVGRAGFNANEAARLAGLAEPEKAAARMRGRGIVQRAIKARIEAIYTDGELTARWVLDQLRAIAGATVDDWFDIEYEDVVGKDGKIEGQRAVCSLNLQKARALGVLGAIKKVKHGPMGVVEVEAYSRLEALTVLAKHFGLLQERLEIIHVQDSEALRRGILEKLDRIAKASAN